MAFRVWLVLVVALVAAMVVAAHSKEYSIDMGLGVDPNGQGLVEDALELDLTMQSESTRWQLAGHSYISYGH